MGPVGPSTLDHVTGYTKLSDLHTGRILRHTDEEHKVDNNYRSSNYEYDDSRYDKVAAEACLMSNICKERKYMYDNMLKWCPNQATVANAKFKIVGTCTQ